MPLIASIPILCIALVSIRIVPFFNAVRIALRAIAISFVFVIFAFLCSWCCLLVTSVILSSVPLLSIQQFDKRKRFLEVFSGRKNAVEQSIQPELRATRFVKAKVFRRNRVNAVVLRIANTFKLCSVDPPFIKHVPLNRGMTMNTF